MRIVLVHRYFWPDTPPYAHILRDIALRLGDDGHEVTVLTCQPSYNRAVVDRAPRLEHLAPNVTVRRWPVLPDRSSGVRKALNLARFCGRLLTSRARLGKVDVVMAASTPPVALAKTASWLAALCGAQFVYHKQDIYPEVVTATGTLRSGAVARALRRIDARTERSAARVVVLSTDMAATVLARGADPRQIEVINNFDPWPLDGEVTEVAARPAQTPAAPLRVVFAGNIGRFQNIETLMEAVAKLSSDPRVRFDFFGDGVLRSHFEDEADRCGLANVTFHGHRAPNEVATVLRDEADVGIVSLHPGVIRAAYPSKTMSYLRQGCPVLTLVESDSELARLIVGAGAGWQVEPTDSVGLADLLSELGRHRDDLAPARMKAAALYRDRFGTDRQLMKWSDLFRSLEPVDNPGQVA